MNTFQYFIDFQFKNNKIYAAFDNLNQSFSKVDNSIHAVDQSINKTVNTVTAQIGHLNQTVSSTGDNIAGSFNTINQSIQAINFASVLDLMDRASQSVANLTAPGIAFEQSMADLSSITGIVGKDLDGLEKKAREVGKSSGLGADAAAQAYALLASQIQVDKIGMEGLQTLQERSVTLAQASGMEMRDAAGALAGTINQFGLSADQADRVINVLAAGSKYGAAEISELSQSFKVVGAACNAAGMDVESTAGALEVLSKNNLKGAEAGTALRNIVLKMQTALKVDFSKTSLSDALTALKPQLKDATALSELFGMENVAAAQFLITNADAVREMTEQVTGTNVAQEQAAIRTATTAQKMKLLTAAIDNAKIGMFELIGPAAGYVTVGGQQLVMIAQLIPLLSGLRSIMLAVAASEKIKTVATTISTGATWLATTAQWALNAAFLASPLGWIVLAIGAVVSVIVLAWKKFDWFRGGLYACWEAIKGFGVMIKDYIIDRLKGILNGLGGLGQALVKLFNKDFKGAWETAKKAGADLLGVDAAKNAVSKFQQIGKDSAAAYEKGVKSFNASQKTEEKTTISPKNTQQVQNAVATSISAAESTDTPDFTSYFDKKKNKKTRSGSSKKVFSLNDVSTVQNKLATSDYTAAMQKLSPKKVEFKPVINQSLSRSPSLSSTTTSTVVQDITQKIDTQKQEYRPEQENNYIRDIMINVRKVAAAITAPLTDSLISSPNMAVSNVTQKLDTQKQEYRPEQENNYIRDIMMNVRKVAAAITIPLAVSLTPLPDIATPDKNIYFPEAGKSTFSPFVANTSAGTSSSKTLKIDRVCENIVINVANTDRKGMEEIRSEIIKVLDEISAYEG